MKILKNSIVVGRESVIVSGRLAGRVDELGSVLPRQEGHNLSHVDWQADVFGGWECGDRRRQAVGVDLDPVGVVGWARIDQGRIEGYQVGAVA